MLDVDRITDFDQLKQLTRLLHRDNQRLHQKLIQLTRELATLRGESAQHRLALEIGQLQAQMDAVQRQLGKVSEKRGSRTASPDEDRPRQRGHGPRPQPKLALEEQIHELPADDRTCPACDSQLEEMGDQFEDSEEITVVERQFKLVRRRRRKYRCRCNGAVVTAPGPKGHLVRPGGRYTVEFAVEVAIDKYLNHRVPRRHAQQSKDRRSKPCCMEDEGRPLGIGVQAQVPNRLELLGSRVRVVSVEGKGAARPHQVGSKKTNVSEPLMTCREVFT